MNIVKQNLNIDAPLSKEIFLWVNGHEPCKV